MKIYDTLGSNYSLGDSLKHLLARGSSSDLAELKSHLATTYGGETYLYYRGRGALSQAIEVSGAEVVFITGYTCWAVEQAVKESGSEVIHVDIDSLTYNISPAALEQAIAGVEKGKKMAIVVQSTYGISYDIKPLELIARKSGLSIIEDLAHSIGMTYSDGRQAGTVGDVTMLSFGRDKIIDTVNGGALIIRTESLHATGVESIQTAPLAQRIRDRIYPIIAWKIRLLSTIGLAGIYYRVVSTLGLVGRSAGGAVMKNCGLPSYKAKLVNIQLAGLEADKARRLDLAASMGLGVPAGSNPLRLPVATAQPSELLKRLAKAGFIFNDTWYSAPVYPARFASDSSYKGKSCPVSESIAARIITIPLHKQLTKQYAKKIKDILDTDART